ICFQESSRVSGASDSLELLGEAMMFGTNDIICAHPFRLVSGRPLRARPAAARNVCCLATICNECLNYERPADKHASAGIRSGAGSGWAGPDGTCQTSGVGAD